MSAFIFIEINVCYSGSNNKVNKKYYYLHFPIHFITHSILSKHFLCFSSISDKDQNLFWLILRWIWDKFILSSMIADILQMIWIKSEVEINLQFFSRIRNFLWNVITSNQHKFRSNVILFLKLKDLRIAINYFMIVHSECRVSNIFRLNSENQWK
jgi:hypothetical protein